MGEKEATEEMIKIMNMSPDDQDKYFNDLPPDRTSTLLVEDLRLKSESAERDSLIKRALSFEFDDFKSPHVCGKVALIAELKQLGYSDLIPKVINGDYDSF